MSEDLKTKIVITADSGVAIAAMKDMSAEMGRMRIEFEKFTSQTTSGSQSATAEIKNADQSVQGLSGSLGNLTAIAGGALSVGALASAMKEAKQAAAEFDKALVEIGTLSTSAKAHIGEYREEIVALSIQSGQPLERLTKGLYDSISAGVGAGDAMKFMAAASQLATAGVSNTAATVDLLTSVLNAYGLPATEADHISDQLFATVQQGKTKIDDLAHSLGRVAPIMKAAGATTAEMMAATADLTNKLPSTAEAVTGLTALVAGLARGNEKLTAAFKEHGYESALAAIKAKGFGEALKVLNEESGGTLDGMMKLIPEITGANSALALGINNAQGFSDKLKSINSSSGLTAAAAKEIGETADMMARKLDAAGVAVKKAFGDDFYAAFGKSNGALSQFLTTIATDHETRQLAEKMVLVSAGALGAAAALQKIVYPLEAYIVAQRAAAAATVAAEAANLAAARSMGAYGAATAEATVAVSLSKTAILGYTAVVAGSVVSIGYAIAAGWDWKIAVDAKNSSLRAGAEALAANRQKIHDYALAHVDSASAVAHLTSLVELGIITQKEAADASAKYAATHAASTEKQKEKAHELTDKEKKELADRLKALEQFTDRYLKATLEKAAYELQAAQKQYDEDLKLAGKSSDLKAKALETYAATAKKIDDDVADKLNKTREAEIKKEADALRKTLDLREGYAVETIKIQLKQDEAEVKVLEEKIKKAAQANTLGVEQFTEYQNALKALTVKRIAEGEAVEEKSLIKMLEDETLTGAAREDIVRQHLARVAAIRGEEAAKETAGLDGVTAAVGEHTRKQEEFWKTFQLNTDAIAEINKTTWTSIRDQIAQSIKTMKLDIGGLGDFFISTLRNIAATAAANQIVLSVAGATGFTSLPATAGVGGLLNLAAPAVTGGAEAAGAAGGGLMGMITGSTPVSLLGAAGHTSGPAAPGLFGVGGELGGGVLGAGAMTGIGLAIGAGILASGILNQSSGPPAGYDKYTYGGIGAIRNHPHDALTADTGLLSQHIQSGSAEGAALVLRQINELNSATSLLADSFYHTDAIGVQMRADWERLAAQGAVLANEIDQTGLQSAATKQEMADLGTSAADYAINAALSGHATNSLTQAALAMATALNVDTASMSSNLDASKKLVDSIGELDSRTSGLANSSRAAALAQSVFNNVALVTPDQLVAMSKGYQTLTDVQVHQSAIVSVLSGNFTGMTQDQKDWIEAATKGAIKASDLAAGFQLNSASAGSLIAAYGGLNTTAQDIETSFGNIGDAGTKAQDGIVKSGKAANDSGPRIKDLGDYTGVAATAAYNANKNFGDLATTLSQMPAHTSISVDINSSAPATKAAATGEWFVPANDAPYSLHYGESVLPANDASIYRSLVTQGLWSPLSRGLMPSSPSGGQQQVNVTNSIGDIIINATPGMDVSALVSEVERRLRSIMLEQSSRGIAWMHPNGLYGAAS